MTLILSKVERSKIAQKKYRDSPHGKAKAFARRNSPEGKAYIKKYYDTTDQKSKQKKYRETTKARELRLRNEGSPEGFKRKRGWLLKKYGMTLKDYDTLFLNQNGLCAICGGSSNGRWNCLFVDHCHRTGKVRGLLCFKCNAAIGMLDDNEEFLLKAIQYLKS